MKIVVNDKQDEVKKAHYELMLEYVKIINNVSKLPFFYIPKKRDNIYFSFFIRLFCEAHIKNKLKYLRVLYIQRAQTVISDEQSAKEDQDWLLHTEILVKDFADTLLSWRSISGLFTILWTFAGGFLTSAFSMILFTKCIKKY